MMWRRVVAMLVLAGLIGLSGCGKAMNQVEGVVTLDGKEVEGATVVFEPAEGKGTPATGVTDSSGKVKLATRGKPGVAPGTYKVTVTKSKAVAASVRPGTPEYEEMMKKSMSGTKTGPKSELPEKYSMASKSTLEVTVPPPSQPVELKLTSK